MTYYIQKNNQRTRFTQRGNAMIYILLALALFGALTIMLGRMNAQSDSKNLDDEMAELRSMEILSYIGSAQSVTDQMMMTGTDIASIDTIIPSAASFNDAPHFNKLYHPQGGGLLYREGLETDISTSSESGWYIQNNINIEWTATTADDLIISALHIARDVCENMNAKIGLTTIPVLNETLAHFFDPADANADLLISNCADCEDFLSLCVEDSAGAFGYYSILQIN